MEQEIKLSKEEKKVYENLLGIMDKEEAIQTILDDREDFIGEEAEEMTEKAKEVMRTIHKAEKAGETKERKATTREVKPDEPKRRIIKFLVKALKQLGGTDNVESTNIQKIVEFDLDGDHYIIDLKRQRKPKK